LALKYGADALYMEELIDRCVVASARDVLPHGLIEFQGDTTKWTQLTRRNVATMSGGMLPNILTIDPLRENGKLICQLDRIDPNLALQTALLVHRA
jgi:hypothetical protein